MKKEKFAPRLAVALLAASLVGMPVVMAATTPIYRASTTSVGGEASALSIPPVLSEDGRYIVFVSTSTILVAGDTNGVADIFRKNLSTGEVIRVSVDSGGVQANAASTTPTISHYGEIVTFSSGATNLVTDDTNGVADRFWKNVDTGAIGRVNTNSLNGQSAAATTSSPSLSKDGRYAVFNSIASDLVVSDTNGVEDVFQKDILSGVIVRVSVDGSGIQANGASGSTHTPAASNDQRYVTFFSDATNLVTGDTNGVGDVFRKDLITGTVIRVSTSSAGVQGDASSLGSPVISGDGNIIIFRSSATNLVTGDTNTVDDIFTKNITTGETKRTSVAKDGTQGNGATGASGFTLSDDGRYLAFLSSASNLAPGDTNGVADAYVQNLITGDIDIISTDVNNVIGNGATGGRPAMSGDGKTVAFWSLASNLVANDTNTTIDVFYRANPLWTAPVVSTPPSTPSQAAIPGAPNTGIASNGNLGVFALISLGLLVSTAPLLLIALRKLLKKYR